MTITINYKCYSDSYHFESKNWAFERDRKEMRVYVNGRLEKIFPNMRKAISIKVEP